MEESNDDLTLDFFYLWICFCFFYHVCLWVFLVHKGVQLSVRVGCLEVSRSPEVCLRRRSGRTPRLAKLQQTGRWLLGKLPNKAPIAGTTKTLGQYLCVYIDIYVYIYIYIYICTQTFAVNISPSQDMTPGWERGSHQRKLCDLCDIQLFFKQRVCSWWTVPIEKVLHHCLLQGWIKLSIWYLQDQGRISILFGSFVA